MKNAACLTLIIAGIILLLILGKGLLIPFVFALLFWFITRRIRLLIDKVPLAKKYLPDWSKNVIIFVLIISAFGMVADALSINIRALTKSYESYEANIQGILTQVESMTNLNINEMMSSADDLDYGTLFGGIATVITGLVGDTFMIIIYVLFIFLEETSFRKKMQQYFAKSDKNNQINTTLNEIEESVSSYLMLKTLVSLLTGFLSYIVLLLVGIDSPLFWAFLIFLLNYIPTIGSLIATLFPAIFSLIQFGEFTPFIIIAAAVGAVQVIVGNIVEPRLMGKSLNLSPIVTIMALAVWGKIWGITGMVLSVPITVIMLIAFAQFESTQTVALILSGNGKIGKEQDEKK